MDERAKDRVVKNEALFRDLNERVDEISHAERVASDEVSDFLCECGNATCMERIRIRLADYEELRATPTHFAVVPGHELPEVERVVADMGNYRVIEKLVGEQQIARVTDPRP